MTRHATIARTTPIATRLRMMSEVRKLTGSALLLVRPAYVSHARRTLLTLSGRVRPDRGTLEYRCGVDEHAAARDAEGEAVEAARRRATALLADAVVLRPVARALEPL